MSENKPGPVPYDDLRESRVVSVWLGQFDTEEAFDEYLDRSFASDFGFEIYPPAGPECGFEEEPKPVRKLLEGFSSAATFIDEAVAGAKRAGVEEATTAVVFYAMRYRPGLINPRGTAQLTFIGTFAFGKPE